MQNLKTRQNRLFPSWSAQSVPLSMRTVYSLSEGIPFSMSFVLFSLRIFLFIVCSQTMHSAFVHHSTGLGVRFRVCIGLPVYSYWSYMCTIRFRIRHLANDSYDTAIYRRHNRVFICLLDWSFGQPNFTFGLNLDHRVTLVVSMKWQPFFSECMSVIMIISLF